MSLPPPSDHFQGKTVVEHLKEARAKGAFASAEIHGAEMPGHLAAGADAARDTSIAFLLLATALHAHQTGWETSLSILLLFAIGWLIWKTGRSALLGWSRLERLHRLIEEERWEIQHNRAQEREELTDLYQAKGFHGKQLEQVIDTLMADDNRLLRVMLEEEMGLTLESYEHPLKQSFGAAIGVSVASIAILASAYLAQITGLLVAVALVLGFSCWLSARTERNQTLPAVIWILAVAFLTAGITYGVFLLQIIR